MSILKSIIKINGEDDWQTLARMADELAEGKASVRLAIGKSVRVTIDGNNENEVEQIDLDMAWLLSTCADGMKRTGKARELAAEARKAGELLLAAASKMDRHALCEAIVRDLAAMADDAPVSAAKCLKIIGRAVDAMRDVS